MTRPTLCLSAVSLLWATPLVVSGQASSNELKLGSASASQGTLASVPLSLSTTDQVQGVEAVFEWDAAVGKGEDLVSGETLAGADTVVKRVGDGFVVLGVVMDSDPSDPGSPEVLGPGTDLLLATAKIRCATGAQTEQSADLKFADGKYPSVEGGPLLDNLVTVGGLSITLDKGLVLTGGTLTCKVPEGRAVFRVESAQSGDDGCGAVRVLMDADVPIEGYVVSIMNPPELELRSIDAGAAATSNGADFTDSDIFAEGGTLGVVMDLVQPFQNNVIPPGESLEIAIYRYCCKTRPSFPSPLATHGLDFVDGIFGNPRKENAAVSGGVTVPLETRNGTFTCTPVAPREICDDGRDNDLDGKTDCDDPDCAGAPNCQPPGQGPMFACGSERLGADGSPVPPVANVKGSVEVCFYYKSPEDNAPGHQQFDHIQGLSMAVCYPCDLTCREGTFGITGTIVDAVRADFVSHQCDNDPNDGDGCELIIGILVDSLPPFDGATLPPTDAFLRIGCMRFTVADKPSLCGTCLPITFCDGADGRGKVPIKNLISTENESRRPQLMNCEVCIMGQPVFHRGDCNFSDMGNMSVDIADAAATISFLFQRGSWKYTPRCLDACDCQDDGRVDLADATCILSFLFQFGPFPPAPGPGFDLNGKDLPPGVDPTDDKLDCQAGGDC
ncbi:MAG: hypothetical protein HY721_18640 [Planctomycetes bacterium]|nr:hypothetical protein [Planctomycetota bacterium]